MIQIPTTPNSNMSMKRPRAVRSSSAGEFELLNLNKSPEVALRETKRSNAAPKLAGKVNSEGKSAPLRETTRRIIFTLGSPFEEENKNGSEKRVDKWNLGFFKTCSYCKNKIPEDENVFMYGFLQAFCSPGCREIQIALDEKTRPPSPVPAAAATLVKQEPAKGMFGSETSKYIIAKFK